MWYLILLLICLLLVLKESAQDIYEITNQLVKSSQDEIQNKECIQYLAQHYNPTDQELVMTNMNLNISLNKSVISIDLSNRNLVLTDRSIMLYILDLRNESIMLSFYQHLEEKYFLPRAKYIIVISIYHDRLVRKLIKSISSYFICKVLVIDNRLNVYTYLPYKFENAMDPDTEPLLLGQCLDVNLINMNAEVYPKLWRNTTLHIYFRLMLPFANEDYSGSEQRLFFLYAMQVGIKLMPVLGPRTFQGIKENGTYQNEGLELLNKGIVQAVGGGYEADADFAKEFDSSSIFHIDSISLIAPKALPRTHWSRVWHTLTLNAKIFFVVGILLWNLFVYYAYDEKIVNLCFLTYAIIHQMPVMKLLTYRYRIPLAFLILGMFVISNMAGNYMQQILFSIQYEYQISSVEEVISSNMPVLVPAEILESYNQSSKRTDKLLLSKMVPCKKEIQFCMYQVCKNRSAVLIATTIFILKNTISQYNCLDAATGNVLYYIGEEIDHSFFQMYFVKGYPPLYALQIILKRVVLYGGIAAKERHESVIQYKKALTRSSRKLRFQELGLDKMYFVFVILGFGFVVSTLILLLEICFSAIRKNKS